MTPELRSRIGHDTGPHNLRVIVRPRTLANVLSDLKEARDDWNDAIADLERDKDDKDADYRAAYADRRIDAYREEFANAFLHLTGLTWKQVEQAIREAIL